MCSKFHDQSRFSTQLRLAQNRLWLFGFGFGFGYNFKPQHAPLFRCCSEQRAASQLGSSLLPKSFVYTFVAVTLCVALMLGLGPIAVPMANCLALLWPTIVKSLRGDCRPDSIHCSLEVRHGEKFIYIFKGFRGGLSFYLLKKYFNLYFHVNEEIFKKY